MYVSLKNRDIEIGKLTIFIFNRRTPYLLAPCVIFWIVKSSVIL
jgi:hypothetical protein